MSQQSWPYAGDAVTETEWSQMSRLWRRSGVVDGAADELEVTAVAGQLQVQVASGQAWLDGFYFASDSPVVLTLATADLGNDRIDLVVVRSDRSEGKARLAVKTGTPGSSPVVPVPVQDHDGDGIFETPLAEVTVGAAAANVDGQVEDARVSSLVPQDDIGVGDVDGLQGELDGLQGELDLLGPAVQSVADDLDNLPTVLQVVYEEELDEVSTTSLTSVMSATITPSAVGNHIVVQTSVPVEVRRDEGTTDGRAGQVFLRRNGNSIDGTQLVGRALGEAASVAAESHGLASHFYREVAASTSPVEFEVLINPFAFARMRKLNNQRAVILIWEFRA